MTANSKLSAFFYDENGNKVTVRSEELFIELNNGQILTLSSFRPDHGITISDHSCVDTVDGEPSEFGVLTITPGACNVVTINSTKHNSNSES